MTVAPYCHIEQSEISLDYLLTNVKFQKKKKRFWAQFYLVITFYIARAS